MGILSSNGLRWLKIGTGGFLGDEYESDVDFMPQIKG